MNDCRIAFRLGPINFILRYPEALDREIWPYFSHLPAAPEGEPATTLHLRSAAESCFDLCNDDRLVWRGLTWPDAFHPILDEIGRVLAAMSAQPLLRAAAVRGDGKAVLIAGPPGSGKTGLAAWLVGQGFEFLADDLVAVAGGRGKLEPIALAFSPHATVAPKILSWPGFAHVHATLTSHGAIIRPGTVAPDRPQKPSCGLILVPLLHEGAAPALEPIPAGQLRFFLEQAVHPDHSLSSAAWENLADFARTVPAVLLRFGSYKQLPGFLDQFVHNFLRADLDPSGLARLLKPRLSRPPAGAAGLSERVVVDAASVQFAMARPPKRLSIGMATYDDYDGVYFTLQALRLYHPEVAGEVEFIVVDNNPDGACGEPLRKLARSIPNYRYVPVADSIGTAVRDVVMREAAGDLVMCLDCHVLVVSGAIARLLHYFDDNPDSIDLLQGPLVNDDLMTISTHWKPRWQQGMLGAWDLDEAGRSPEAPPFDIPMQGLGLYACRRAAWPGYNGHFRGFGGEEGYIHEKFRQAGGRTLCLPFLRWLHRFERPMGAPYPISWHDRIRNYMIGFDELGLPMEEMLAHFRAHVGPVAEAIIRQTEQEIERIRAGAG
ncbi:glycosyltransferase [Labrys okinawensis]|uniref:glycosyltransferase n=1 Tax=Labrys okinawensis TaxID=346911 RepID=UPI0039BC4A5B